MGRHKATAKNIGHVLCRIQVQAANDPEYAEWWAEQINRACDRAGDFFGTEGQNDPRGDQRA